MDLDKEANLYGNPYYSMLRPVDKTTLFNEGCLFGNRPTFANYYPHYVDAKSGNIIVSERDNNRIQLFDNVGRQGRFEPFGTVGSGSNQFQKPSGVTTTNKMMASIVVCDTGNRRVNLFKVGSDHYGYGKIEQTFAFGHRVFQEPVGVEYDPQRKRLIVADAGTSRISMHDLKTGQCGGEFRPPRECPLLRPLDVAVDQRGLWYVSDSDRHCIYIFEKNGEFVGKFGNGCGSGENQFNHPWGICFDREDNLLIADTGNNRIVMYRMSQGGLGAGTFVRVVTEDVHAPKGLSINAHQNLVLVDGNANSFVKIFKYK